jgi:hypothetical protein
MDATAIADALRAWAEETIPALAGSGYSYPPMGKSKDLPDVVGGVDQESEAIRDDRFPWSQIQQTGVHLFESSISIMAEQGKTEEEAEAAMLFLRTTVAELFAARRADNTLGGRVFDTGPEVSADYDPGFVQYADGSRGREVRITLTVAEPLEPSQP